MSHLTDSACEECKKRPAERSCHDCNRSLCRDCWIGTGPAPGYLCSDCEDLEVENAIAAEVAECLTCDGRGYIEKRRHRDDCRCVIRRDPDCARVVNLRCPACATSELGEDLVS